MIDQAIPHWAHRDAAAAGEDLSSLGPLRRRGQRYAINPLVEQPALVLGLEHESRFGIAAIFDRSPEVNASMEHDIQRDCNAADGEAQA